MQPIWQSPRIMTAIGGAVLLACFGLLADEVLEGDTLTFDNAVLALFRSPANPEMPIGPTWLQEAVRDVTGLGSFTVLGLLTVVVVLGLLLRGRTQTGWFLAFAVVSGAIVSTGLKALFDRPRPALESVAKVFTSSFPSGHALVSTVVFLTIGVMLAGAASRPALRVYYIAVAALLSLLVGLSRIYLGVHYPTDVIAGWLLGTAWALLCWAGATILLPKRREAPDLRLG